MNKSEIEQLTEKIIGCAIEVHRILGPGLLESAYEECLCRELDLHGIHYQRQVNLPVWYKGVSVECGYRLDPVVMDTVIVEIKAIERLTPVHEAQLLTYLKLSRWKVGLFFIFNVSLLKDGIQRRIMGKIE